jgi:5'(3')-deoxyribonucleotidase
MGTERKSIAVDMDGVIADTAEQFLNWYEMKHGVRIPKEQLQGVSELEALPNQAARIFVFEAGFFRGVPVMEGAKEAVQELMKYFEVYIVSAAMEFPQSLAEKYEWLREHFPFVHWKNIIFCGDKSIINTDYMIDDHVKNLDVCKGRPFLFTAAHNIRIDRHTRVNNWQEAITLLKKEIEPGSRGKIKPIE